MQVQLHLLILNVKATVGHELLYNVDDDLAPLTHSQQALVGEVMRNELDQRRGEGEQHYEHGVDAERKCCTDTVQPQNVTIIAPSVLYPLPCLCLWEVGVMKLIKGMAKENSARNIALTLHTRTRMEPFSKQHLLLQLAIYEDEGYVAQGYAPLLDKAGKH